MKSLVQSINEAKQKSVEEVIAALRGIFHKNDLLGAVADKDKIKAISDDLKRYLKKTPKKKDSIILALHTWNGASQVKRIKEGLKKAGIVPLQVWVEKGQEDEYYIEIEK